MTSKDKKIVGEYLVNLLKVSEVESLAEYIKAGCVLPLVTLKEDKEKLKAIFPEIAEDIDEQGTDKEEIKAFIRYNVDIKVTSGIAGVWQH